MHLQYFHDFSNTDFGKAFSRSDDILNLIISKMHEALSNHIQVICDTMTSKDNLHIHIGINTICNLEAERLHEAYAIIPNGMKKRVKKVFWKKKKQEGSAWAIDQSKLPESLRLPRLMKFGAHIISLIEGKQHAMLKQLIKKVPPEEIARIQWPWNYSALMFAAKCGGLKVAKVFLEVQIGKVSDHRGRHFCEFLAEHCEQFIPIYKSWLRDQTLFQIYEDQIKSFL